MQNCRSSVTIEQNGDTGGTVAQFDNDTNLAGSSVETGGAKVIILKRVPTAILSVSEPSSGLLMTELSAKIARKKGSDRVMPRH